MLDGKALRGVVGVILAGAALVAIFLVFAVKKTPPDGDPKNGDPKRVRGFKESAEEAGIDFHMNFLPSEQGEKFKINLYDHGCGVAVADVDGDGLEDIYFCNQLGRNGLFHNNGDGTFVDVARKAGVSVPGRVSVGAAFGDTLNQGRPDLYVTTTRGGNLFFRNNGDGTFTDMTEKAGLTLVAHSQTAVFFDYDNDGLLDLFVTNTAEWTLKDLDASGKFFPGPSNLFDLLDSPIEHNVLYHNNGDGTFTDVTEKSGLKGRGWGGDVAVFDYDEDGYLDILVTNMFGQSQLYRNNGDGTFTDVTAQTLGRTSFGAIGAKAFDLNNDGRLDLLIVDMHSDMWVTPGVHRKENIIENKKYTKTTGPTFDLPSGKKRESMLHELLHLNYSEVVFGNTLFKNLGGGKFQEISDEAGMETFWPWGIATGDFNNDGYEDVFLPSGMGYPFFYWPNRLMMNNGNETFSERSEEEGIEPPRYGMYLEKKIAMTAAARSSRCAAVADFSNTGRLDIVTNNFNDVPYFFKNQFPKKNYISFKLEGTKSNRDAIGAVVRITMGKEVMVRQVQAAGGYLSQSSKTVHFGLGDRTDVDRVEIRWPSGLRQTIERPAINERHDIKEKAK